MWFDNWTNKQINLIVHLKYNFSHSEMPTSVIKIIWYNYLTELFIELTPELFWGTSNLLCRMKLKTVHYFQMFYAMQYANL